MLTPLSLVNLVGNSHVDSVSTYALTKLSDHNRARMVDIYMF